MAWDFGINPEIISGILNFRDWKFWDSGLLKLPGLGFSGFRIPEHQDFPGFPFFRDPEPLPSWNKRGGSTKVVLRLGAQSSYGVKYFEGSNAV